MVRGKRAAMRRGNMLWQRKTAYIEDIEDWVDEPDGSWTYEGYDFNAYIIPEKSGEYELDRKSTRLTPVTVVNLVCRLLLEFFNDTATTEIYTLSLHDALPIC